MKINDIEIGKDYAVSDRGMIIQGTVVEITEHTRKVYTSRWGHEATSTMVRVRRPDLYNSPLYDTWVMPSQVKEPWENEAARRSVQDAARKTKGEAMDRLERALHSKGIECSVNPTGSVFMHAILSVEQAHQLADILESTQGAE